MKRAVWSFVMIALLFGGATQVKADPFTVYVFQNEQAAGSNATLDQFTTLGGAAKSDARFTTSSFLYDSNNTGYTPYLFFNRPTFTNTSATWAPNATLDNTYVYGTGMVYLTAGQYVTIYHDDGAQVKLTSESDGTSQTFGSTGPTTTILEASGKITKTGYYELDLSYGEVNGPPGVLALGASTDPSKFGSPLVAVPEPSSIAMAAIGLATLGLHRLRRRKPVVA